MPAYYGDLRIEKVFKGSTPIAKIYRGDVLVWTGEYKLITDNLLQNLAQPDGMSIYQDTDGVNLKDRWFMPDNTPGSKLRPIQPGRGYAFTKSQTIVAPFLSAMNTQDFEIKARFSIATIPAGQANCIYMVGNFNEAAPNYYRYGVELRHLDNGKVFVVCGSGTDSNIIGCTIEKVLSLSTIYDLSVRRINLVWTAKVNGEVITCTPVQTSASNTITYYQANGVGVYGTWSGGTQILNYKMSGSIFNIEHYSVNPSTLEKTKLLNWNCNEGGGLIAYDSSGNGNHGTITLGGGAESNFHTTNILVPNIQNTVGHGKPPNLSPNLRVDFITSASGSYTISTATLVGDAQEWVRTGGTGTGYAGWRMIYIYSTPTILNTLYRVTVRFMTNSTTVWNTTTLPVSDSNVIIKSVTSIGDGWLEILFIPILSTWQLVLGWNASGMVVGSKCQVKKYEIASLVPLNESNPDYDALGNLVPELYKGAVRREAQVRLSNLAYANGVSVINVNNNAIGLTSNVFTLSVKYQINSVTSNGHIFTYGYWYNGSVLHGLKVFANGTVTYIQVGNGSTNPNQFAYTFTVVTGAVVHLVFNFKTGGLAYVYNNGVLVASNINHGMQMANGYTAFGAYYYNGAWNNKQPVYAYHLSVAPSSPENVTKALAGNVMDGEFMRYNFSEGIGPKVYNTAANRPANSDMNVILNGAADTTQWTTSDYARPTNLIDGWSVLFNLIGGTVSADIGMSSTSVGGGYYRIQGSRGVNNNCIGIRFIEKGYRYSEGDRIRIRFTIRNRLNGIPDRFALLGPNATLGTTGVSEFTTQSFYVGVNEIVISVTDPYSLISPNIIYTNGLVQLQSTTHATYDFEIGDISYEILAKIPEDANNQGFDTNGNPLTYVGDGKQIIPSESKFNRNALSNPELFAAGLGPSEAASYEEIVGNTTRLYDKDGNVVSKILSYSDIKEPIGGGFLQLRNGNRFEFPSLTAMRPPANQNWTVRVRCKINTSQSYVPIFDYRPSYDGGGAAMWWDETNKRIRTRYASGSESYLSIGFSIIGLDVIFAMGQQGGSDNDIFCIYIPSIGYYGQAVWGGGGVGTNGGGTVCRIGYDVSLPTPTYAVSMDVYSVEVSRNGYHGGVGQSAIFASVNPLPNLAGRFMFSESKGTVSYSVAQDRTEIVTGTHVLNAIPETTAWGLSGGNPYKHELTYGYYRDANDVDIPGDPYNPGFAVNGQPINNQAEVTKYNKVRQYLDQ